MNTSTEEFDKWLKLLPWNPYLFPCVKNGKEPDIPKDESWKDEKWHLTVEQARERLKSGLNVGVVAVGDYVFWDHDNLEKFNFPVETLTVMTRSGKLHKYFVNSGDVKNADGKGQYKGCGEIRAEWKYVVAPGSYVPPGDDAQPEATGLYRVVNAEPPALLSSSDLPPEFLPGFKEEREDKPERPKMTGSFRNQYGWSIEKIRERDKKLDDLLSTLQPAGYPSPSEADMAALSKLLFWGYQENEAIDILKYFRSRDKLNREDYVKMTLSKVARGETIANYIDPSKWNPTSGYGLPFEAENPDFDVTHKISLEFKVVSKREVKVKAVKEGKGVTAWITLDRPEKLRTSHNAKVLREVLEKEHPADWRIILERAIERMQAAVANFKPEKPEKETETEAELDVKAEVERILTSENPLTEVKKHLDNTIAGEDANKLTIFLLLLSGKCPDPSLKQMVLLKSEAGAGKTTLMTIADFFKTKKVGRFTEHALEYSDLEGYEILELLEVGTMDEEKQGVSALKFLSSDDRGFIVEFTVKDPETQEFATKQHHIPPITLISSTTRISLDPQYTRRNWILSPDESEQQTIRVRDWFVRYEMEKNEVILGLRKETSYEHSKKVLGALVKQIQPTTVIVPFVNTLTKFLETSSLRVRGDYKKLNALVKFYCILTQRNLPKVPATKSNAIIATPGAGMTALNVALGPLTLMTTELDERTKKTLDVLTSLGVTKKSDLITADIRDDIARKRGVSPSTIRLYLNELERKSYLGSKGKGTKSDPKEWYLLYDMSVIKRKLSAITAQFESSGILMDEMLKETETTLKRFLLTEKVGSQEIFSRRENYIGAQDFSINGIELTEKQGSSGESDVKRPNFGKITEYSELKEKEPEITLAKFNIAEVAGCTQLEITSIGECDMCRKKPLDLAYHVKTFTHHHSVCVDCAVKIMKYLKEEGKT